MPQATQLGALVIASFLSGSVPFGVLFARARGIDLRAIGSGNIGATNAARALGKRMGIVVFLCDAAKGLVPVLIARWLGAPFFGGASEAEIAVGAAGAAAFLGHLYPPWLGFRGGKGVATAFGVFLGISPLAALGAIALFGVVYGIWRVSSLGSLASSTAFVPLLLWRGEPRAYVTLAAFMWAVIVWKHRGNIARLIRREESKI